MHGNRAHADWWSFIAPFFAEDYRVAALSLAGMGDSEWRAFYAGEGHVDDLGAVAQAAGLHEGGRKPVYIGHSFGGGVVFQAAALRPERLHAAILIDVGLTGRTAERIIADSQRRMAETSAAAGAKGPRHNAVYATLADALARFRLSPPQPLENLFIVDYIARRALKRAPLPDGGEGWTWKFDPDLWEKLDRDVMTRLQATGGAVELPMAHVYGDKSPFRPEKGRAGVFPAHTIEIGVPEAHHHVPIDQPLGLVAALRALLAAWRA